MKNVLITGGTGSLGKSLLNNLIQNKKLEKIIVYSRDELKQSDLQNIYDDPRLRFFIGDVRDYERTEFATKNVDTIIHTAALKQVPAAEYNPDEPIKTNINGAQNIIKASIKNEVSKVVALSTDKAANPVNMYGATKLASDKLFSAANNYTGLNKTIFSIVRYGNVLGSRGSVVPFFNELIKNNSSYLPITHFDMTRFWITLEEATDFVLKTINRMKGGEIFVPKIPSVRIVDIAKAMKPELELKEIGIRPGEKLHELLCPIDENHRTYEYSDFFVIGPTTNEFRNIDFSTTNLKEKGKLVKSEFEYNSFNNKHYLNVEEINQLLASNNLL
tara:strand:+ start:11361 stop:12353 length:993 start_codon:yes stop_codon:yes gene_type:complete